MTFTKATLIKKLEDELEISPTEARERLETLIEIIKVTLESGKNIAVSGFGRF